MNIIHTTSKEIRSSEENAPSGETNLGYTSVILPGIELQRGVVWV